MKNRFKYLRSTIFDSTKSKFEWVASNILSFQKTQLHYYKDPICQISFSELTWLNYYYYPHLWFNLTTLTPSFTWNCYAKVQICFETWRQYHDDFYSTQETTWFTFQRQLAWPLIYFYICQWQTEICYSLSLSINSELKF